MKRVKQFRYYNVLGGEKANYPDGLRKAFLVSGSAFADYMPVVQLGIQSLPGTKFYLNNSLNPIIIGATGIYELDLNGLAEITSLAFESKSIDIINEAPSASLIVDIIYEDGVE